MIRLKGLWSCFTVKTFSVRGSQDNNIKPKSEVTALHSSGTNYSPIHLRLLSQRRFKHCLGHDYFLLWHIEYLHSHETGRVFELDTFQVKIVQLLEKTKNRRKAARDGRHSKMDILKKTSFEEFDHKSANLTKNMLKRSGKLCQKIFNLWKWILTFWISVIIKLN